MHMRLISGFPRQKACRKCVRRFS
ncbi:hypothetical protein [Fibrobacter sp.]